VEEVWEVSRAFVVGGSLCETWDEGFFHREGAKGAKLGGWGDGEMGRWGMGDGGWGFDFSG
jgi:hypothetical protein